MQLLAIWWHMEITSKLFLNGNSFLLQQYCIIIFVTFCTACNFIIFLHCFHVKSGAYFIPCYFWWWRAMQWTLQYQPSVEQNSVSGLLWHITRHFWRLWNIMKYIYNIVLACVESTQASTIVCQCSLVLRAPLRVLPGQISISLYTIQCYSVYITSRVSFLCIPVQLIISTIKSYCLFITPPHATPTRVTVLSWHLHSVSLSPPALHRRTQPGHRTWAPPQLCNVHLSKPRTWVT